MTTALHQTVRDEIIAVHEFFQSWFTGRAPQTDACFDAGLSSRLASDFQIIMPGGGTMDAGSLIESIRSGYGGTPDFRIQISKVQIRLHNDALVIATYEEWQRNARNSTPPDNGRVVTVVFERIDGLRWRHIHETWLPASVINSSAFDF